MVASNPSLPSTEGSVGLLVFTTQGVLTMTTKDICLDSLPEVESREPAPLDVWVKLPPDANGCSGYIRRKRFRTYNEIARDLNKFLDRIRCKSCGKEWPRKHNWYMDESAYSCCGRDADIRELIDEYSATQCRYHLDDCEIVNSDKEEFIKPIAYCDVGGNEGYNAHLSVVVRRKEDDAFIYRPVYRIKSFAGMEWVHYLAKQIDIAVNGRFGWQ